MNWIRPEELYNKLNLSHGRTVCLSRPHYMLLLDVRGRLDYENGHLPTALRVIKGKEKDKNVWQVTGGFADITDKEAVVMYDMSTSRSLTSQPAGPLADAASYVLRLLVGSRNQSNVYLLDGGLNSFTELYPNFKTHQATYTIGELENFQIFPLHIPIFELDWGKLFFSPPDSVGSDRVAHVLADIDAHVNCSVIRDPAFGYSAEEKSRVHYCVLDNEPDIDAESKLENLKEIYNVCLYIDAHLRDGRNVLVFGDKGNTTAVAVLAAYLLFHEFMDLEEAMQRICRCYPLAVLDQTSLACLEEFYDKLRNDSQFQTGLPFVIVEDMSAKPEQPIVNFQKGFDPATDQKSSVSIVSSLMKEVISDLEKQSQTKSKHHNSSVINAEAAVDIVGQIVEQAEADMTDSFDEAVDGNSPTQPSVAIKAEWSASGELEVTRLEVRRLEEETLWKGNLHHDRVIPDLHETGTLLRRRAMAVQKQMLPVTMMAKDGKKVHATDEKTKAKDTTYKRANGSREFIEILASKPTATSKTSPEESDLEWRDLPQRTTQSQLLAPDATISQAEVPKSTRISPLDLGDRMQSSTENISIPDFMVDLQKSEHIGERTNVTRFLRDVDRLKELVKDLTRQNSHLTKDKAFLTGRNEYLEKSNQDLSKRLTTATDQASSLQKSKEDLLLQTREICEQDRQHYLQSFQKVLKNMDTEKMKDLNRAVRKQVQAYETQILQLQATRRELVEERSTMKGELLDLRQKLSAAELASATGATERSQNLSELQLTLMARSHELQQTKAQLEAAVERLQQLTGQVEFLKEKNQIILRDREALQSERDAEVARLATALQTKSSQLEAYEKLSESDIRHLKLSLSRDQDIEEKQKTIRLLSEKITELQRALEDTAKTETTTIVRQQEQQIARLTGDVQNLQSELRFEKETLERVRRTRDELYDVVSSDPRYRDEFPSRLPS
ncbi:hypothetical protein BV898_02700 [Hypsibius exemplaris]|uniref:Rhodanese domain-containing protein n=1 Tax=Hypsibius exemplaris TaxID=2072580 RepID=A0A1W0X8D1_HYPEX|nr:hypothetical protein BV898_02700 [Hypsibius exemplaris]